jgi:nondiscriminating aspartyl-tRNA synthetase
VQTVQRIHVEELPEHSGERVRVAGWLHHQRQLSRRTFLLLRDRSGIAQAVLERPETIAEAAALESESVLEVEGLAVAAPQAPGGVELHEPELRVLAPAAAPPPVDLRLAVPKERLPTRLDHAPVALRHPRARATFELAAASVAGFRATLDRLGFVEVQTPKVVGTATESGANVFRLDWFGRPAFLAQSPQFYKQTMVGVFERVYEVGPVFRAEPHDTARHLAEYVSLDAELGFVRDHFDVMAALREVVAGMVEGTRERAPRALELLEVELPEVPAEIPWLHFSETGVDGVDLAPADERRLGERYGDFVFVTGYPMAKRPFYTHPEPGRPGFSNSFDLIFRGLELVTGGQRLHRYEDYVAALAARGEDPQAYAGYLETFRHGMPPHGGFAIGLERWLARLLDVPNIRETTLFPRDLNRLAP